MKMKKFAALAAVTAAALLASTSPAALAEESKGAITPEVRALMVTQAKLHKIAEKVERVDGFSGFYVDAGSKTLNVYWKNEAPAKVKAVAAVAKAQGLTVKVHKAKFSEAELKAEAARLSKANTSISSVAPKFDGSGLSVTQSAGVSLKSGVGIQSSVPVDVTVGEATFAAASRLNDEPAYKGGSYIENWWGGQLLGACSTGFAVTNNSTGVDKLLTAAHCGAQNTNQTNYNGTLIGVVENRSEGWDAELISANPAKPSVWIGESVQTNVNQFELDVVGASTTLAGDWLCDSGAFSGTICQIRAEATGITLRFDDPNGGPSVYVYDNVRAVHTGNYSAGGNGDSGGPVFSVDSANKLTARGTLTAISLVDGNERACSGVPTDEFRKCSRVIYYPDITKQLSAVNARIKTVS